MDTQTILPLVIIFGALYLAFPRPFENLFMQIFKRKSYVVVMFKRANTDAIEEWLKDPPSDKQTSIRKGMYNLSDQYIAGKKNGRSYFLVDEKDNVPRTLNEGSADRKAFDLWLQSGKKLKLEFGKYSDEDIIFQGQEVKTTIVNRMADLLFGERKDMIFWIVLALVVVNAFLAWYEVSLLKEMAPYIAKFDSIDWQTLNNVTKSFPSNPTVIVNP